MTIETRGEVSLVANTLLTYAEEVAAGAARLAERADLCDGTRKIARAAQAQSVELARTLASVGAGVRLMSNGHKKEGA